MYFVHNWWLEARHPEMFCLSFNFSGRMKVKRSNKEKKKKHSNFNNLNSNCQKKT